jgi:Cu2+-exporting ATPase
MANIKKQTIKISGMMCDGCENKVKTAIQAVEGVSAVKVSHTDGKADVEYDADKTDPLFINMAINNTQYKVVE